MINFPIIPIKEGDQIALSKLENKFPSVKRLKNNGD